MVSKYWPRTTLQRTTGVRAGAPAGVSGTASVTLPSPLIGT